jgi:CheY-like chemotaxis protein
MRRHIFERFAQSDSSATRSRQGTGLGLTISERLVTLMGGRIGLDAGEDGGSLFWFTVPLERHQDRRSWAQSFEADVTDRRILVVDDNPMNRRVLEKQLTALGAKVTVAASAEIGFARMQAAVEGGAPFAAAIIDHMMPGTDGLDLGAMLRKAEWRAGTKLVLASSAGRINTHGKARRCGFDAALPKPLRPGALRRCIGELIRGEPNYRRSGKRGGGAAADHPAGVRILLAEDNHVSQKVAAQLLRDRGHSVDVVANGLEAVEAVRNFPYRLVLMNVRMPEMDGLEATRRIRRLGGGGASAAVIGVAARTSAADCERMLEAGMDDYLSKPLEEAALLEMIALWSRPRDEGTAPRRMAV